MTQRPPSGADRGAPEAAEAFTPTLYDVVRDLRRDVAAVRLPLDLPGRADALGSRERLLGQLDQHLLPRLKELSAPAVVVVAGSTGAGKSTLYNSVLGAEVSPAGVLRPTTREPVYAHHPADADVVPAEAPVTTQSRVVASEAVPRGIALLDAPDLDSLEESNRDTARLLLEGADLWLFVTTAARYGDALPWQTLELATERGASVAMVLNRVPRDTLPTIRADLMARLREHGMESTPLFVVPDLGPHEGLLDDPVVAPVRRWLTLLAGRERSRSVVVRTLQGSLDALPAWVARLAEAVEAQVAAGAEIRSAVRAALPDVAAAARRGVLAGGVAHGSVASGWAQLAHARVDAVKVKDGVARSSKRAGRKREAAIEPVLADLLASVGHTWESTADAADAALQAALTGDGAPEGGSDVAPLVSEGALDRPSRARAAASAWEDEATSAVRELTGTRATAARQAYGDRGLGALLLLGAAGLDDAARAAARVVGDDAGTIVERLRGSLADRVAAVPGAIAEGVLARVDGSPFADDAASGLRLRRAELVRQTRHARAMRGGGARTPSGPAAVGRGTGRTAAAPTHGTEGAA
ncbi:GTPase [Luteimicrobium album]|uniref:GTPase n=1 Tax=Luteimicrobium album TaxID=1054550 RepID=UPI0024E0BB0E|nr:GTPase domain-containing protein [Luteimicrobium album]